jgi:hypothetical protein
MSTLSIDPNQIALQLFGIGSTQSITGVSSTQAGQTGTQAIDSDGDSDGSVGPASSTHISQQAQLLSKLQQLEQSNPTEYKQLLTNAANQLTTAAQSATGQDQQFLTSLASKFTQAANGDLSALEPDQQSGSSSSNGTTNTSSSLTSQALAAYAQAQGSQSSLTLPDLSQNGSTSSTSSTSGHHHHHHGGGSSSTQSAVSNVFQQLASALGLSTDSSSSSSTSTSAGTQSVLQDSSNQ